MYDYLIVGVGFYYGVVFADEARKRGKIILVVRKCH